MSAETWGWDVLSAEREDKIFLSHIVDTCRKVRMY